MRKKTTPVRVVRAVLGVKEKRKKQRTGVRVDAPLTVEDEVDGLRQTALFLQQVHRLLVREAALKQLPQLARLKHKAGNHYHFFLVVLPSDKRRADGDNNNNEEL